MKNKRKQFGFTLVELVMAIGILVLMVAIASYLFKVSIETRRVAGANAEIMQKLRQMTEQLDRDFNGLRKDAPMFVWFHQDDPNNRYDQIMFFANGDFQSSKTYNNNFIPSSAGTPLIGTAARIYYGHARIAVDVNSWIYPWNQVFDQSPIQRKHHKAKTLSRQQYIYYPNIPPASRWYDNLFFGYAALEGVYNKYLRKDFFETDCNDLSQWKSTDFINYMDKNVIAATFGDRAYVDFTDPNTIHNIFCEGVGSFGIQLAYQWEPGIIGGDRRPRWFWYPSRDPNEDQNLTMASHFYKLRDDPCDVMFGVYFNVQSPAASGYWYDVGNPSLRYAETTLGSGIYKSFRPDYFPRAIKFTFRLYDSKGVIKNGRLFTHIVYLEN